MAAGPLLVASQTDDARLVAMAGLLRGLPWLLIGLYAGAHGRPARPAYGRGDREPRAQPSSSRCSAPRSPPATCPSRSCWSRSSRWAWPRCSPTRPRARSPRCSSTRPTSGSPTPGCRPASSPANQLVGPPVGAFLFAAGMVWPFVSQLVCVAARRGAGVAHRLAPATRCATSVDTHVRQDIVEGIRWLWGHAAIRTLAIVILTFNITWGAAVVDPRALVPRPGAAWGRWASAC